MRVSDIMTPDPVTIGPDEVLATAIDRMSRFDIKELPVVQEGQLVGILTDRDVRQAMGLAGRDADIADLPDDIATMTVEEVMTPDPVTLSPEMPLSEAAHILAVMRVGAAPVVDLEGKLVGILSVTDILSEAARRFEEEE